MIETEAYVLTAPATANGQASLKLETILLSPPGPDELLVRPIFGCWEGNMGHAITRTPVDMRSLRGEEQVVLGNAGVVWVERVGSAVKDIKPGDVGLIFCAGDLDEVGYPKSIYGYDQPGSVGILAKRTKLKRHQLIRLPPSPLAVLRQWAAFSLRYITAWSNWRTAHACWMTQMGGRTGRACVMFGYGGGVAFAQASLARLFGWEAYMTTAREERQAFITEAGIQPVLLSDTTALGVDEILSDFGKRTLQGRGVDILVDNIGAHFKTSLKMLARGGVIATSGWKHQTLFPILRPQECVNRHLHVFTHYARHAEGRQAVAFARRTGWLPPVESRTWSWNEIPVLAQAYVDDEPTSYFPIYQVNGLPE